MKIDFSQELKTITGDTLVRDVVRDGQSQRIPATLRWAAVDALLTVPADGGKVTAEDKANRYNLALRIQESTTSIEVSVDDLTFIKGCCDAHFAPLVMGQTRKLLDPPGETTESK